MNILKKALILCLALCMVFTSCVSAFAFDGIFDLIGRSKADNSTYVAFGDSITRGCNGYTDDDVSLDDYTSFGQRNVAFSYSYQLSKMLGYSAENIEDDNDITKKDARYWPIAQNAITTAFVLDLLGVEDFYTDKDYLFADHYMSEIYYKKRYNTMLYYFGDKYSKTPDGGLVGFSKEYKDNYGTVRNIHELIRSASLVTVELGIGDVIYRPVELAFSRQGIDISNTDSIIAGVKTIMSEMIKGYSYWYRNYPRLLDYLKLNTKKDCDIVLVGVINPLFNMNITSEDYIPLGNLISVLTNAMNRRYKELADEYGFKFVDISNVETGSTMDDYNIWTYLTNAEHYQYYTHPYAFDKDDLNQTISKDCGYAQIANWIYDELKDEKGFSLKTTVKLDPGRLENIETVKVNGIKWNLHYYDKDGNLYVPCLSPFADKLSISGTGSDGKTQLSIYKLKYDNGYSAIRTYTTNDLDRAVETTKAQIKGLIGL